MNHKSRWQQLQLVILVILNVVSWNFVVFWRHEAYDLRARLALNHCDCSSSPPSDHVSMATNPSNPSLSNPRVAMATPPLDSPSLEKLIDVLTDGGLCPRNISDVAVWKAAIPTLPFLPRGGNVRGELYPNGSYAHFDTASGPYSAQWFCDKIATTLDPWIEPSGALDVADIIVGVYSGESLFYSRASATSATWRTEIPNTYIYASHSSPTVPVVGIGVRYGLRPDFETLSDVQPLQIVAVRDMYLRHPKAKWYYIIGDDVYIVANALVRMLEGYDASKEIWLTQYPGERPVPPGFDVSSWPDRTPLVDARGVFSWQAGGSGWFISTPLARKWAEHAERFVRAPGIDQNCNCPDVYSGLLLTLLGATPERLPGEWAVRMSGGSEQDEHSALQYTPDPVMWHYQHPRRMLGAHQWAVHRKIDRMVNLIADHASRNNITGTRRGLALLVKSYRDFVNAQMDTLRRWQSSMARLARQSGTPFRGYDIPIMGGVLFDRPDDWLIAYEIEPHRQRTRATVEAADATAAVAPPIEQSHATVGASQCTGNIDTTPMHARPTRARGEIDLFFQSRSAVAALLERTTPGDMHCLCNASSSGATTPTQFIGFCERLPRFVDLAALAAPGYTQLGHNDNSLNPYHAGHNYEEILPLLLERFRGTPVRFVHIGSTMGLETTFWRAYFGTRSHIVAIDDRHPLDMQLEHESNTHVAEVAQQDRSAARNAYESAVGFSYAGASESGAYVKAQTLLGGAFDVVFDDGSHHESDQRTAFEAMFPRMTSGGVYVVAGLNAAYAKASPTSWTNMTKLMIDTMNRRVHNPRFAVLTGSVDQMIHSVTCAEEVCAYVKR
jgi:hypothetical protein